MKHKQHCITKDFNNDSCNCHQATIPQFPSPTVSPANCTCTCHNLPPTKERTVNLPEINTSLTVRNQIAQILTKWNMPTRQIAISEIESLLSHAIQEERERIAKDLEKQAFLLYEEGYNGQRTLYDRNVSLAKEFLLREIITRLTKE